MTTSDATAAERIPVDWYFDFVSPFAYLQLEQFDRLPANLDITLRPVVLGGLLAHWEQKGPAEIPAKRTHTYRYCQFRAEQLSIPFKMPPAHPFNPISVLRLAVALGSGKPMVQAIFRYLWRDGCSVAAGPEWQALCEHLQISNADELISREAVKQELRANGDRAIEQGVFGVPSFVVEKNIFWGEDATSMLLHHLQHPEWLQSSELMRISQLPVGIQRKL
jgi:2-hydroxychromene-2-carboxylate isomerase